MNFVNVDPQLYLALALFAAAMLCVCLSAWLFYRQRLQDAYTERDQMAARLRASQEREAAHLVTEHRELRDRGATHLHVPGGVVGAPPPEAQWHAQ